MYWASDRSERGSRRVLAKAILLVCFLTALSALASAAPDSLTVKQMQTINKLAEVRLKDYIWALKAMAELTDSDDDALLAQDYINDHLSGEARLFYKPETTIEDNVDPALTPGSTGLERLVDVYLKELRLHFRMEGDAVQYNLLMRGEPKSDAFVHTQLLYEMRFIGTHVDRPGVAYTTQKRILELILQQKADGKWNVWVAGDRYYDPAKPFVQFHVDRELEEAKASGAAETPELAAYKEAQREAQAQVDEELARRKKAYEGAVKAGQDAVAAGEYEAAIAYFGEARKLDPLSIDPLVLSRKTQRAWDLKVQGDKKLVDELVRKSEELKSMREYDRALVAVQQAMNVMPDDPRCGPLRDSLQVRSRMKADREAAYRTGNYEACIKAAKERLRLAPSDAEALTLLAKCYNKTNKRSEALDHVERALRFEPFLAEALFLRAQLYEGSGAEEDKRKASVDYDVLIRHDPWYPLYVQRLAYLTCFGQKNCRKASDLLKESLQREPGDVETLYWLGRVHGFGNTGQLLEYPEALRYLNNAVEVDSTCGKCYLERGVTLLMMDSVGPATRSVEHAKRFRLPEEEWRRVRYLAKKNIDDAIEQQGKGFHAQAVKLFTAACVLHPDTAVYWAYNAGNLMKLARYKEALVPLDRYIELVDADYNGRLDRAYCLLKLGRYDESLAEVDRVQRNDPKGDFAEKSNRLAGEACFLKGDLAGAERFLKESYRRRKENPDVLSMLAQTTYARGSYAEAEHFAEDAIDVVRKAKGAMGGEDPKSHFYLGLIRQKMGEPKKSILSFEEARSYGYKSSEVQKQIGISRMLLEDWKGAIVNFQEVLRDTLDREAVVNMAECMKREKMYREALNAMTNLQERQPDVGDKPEFQAELGFLFVLNDMMTDANNAISSAYSADPDYRKTILARIAMFWKGSRQEEAVKALAVLVDTRAQVTEKELKDWPILKDMIESPMWKKRAK